MHINLLKQMFKEQKKYILHISVNTQHSWSMHLTVICHLHASYSGWTLLESRQWCTCRVWPIHILVISFWSDGLHTTWQLLSHIKTITKLLEKLITCVRPFYMTSSCVLRLLCWLDLFQHTSYLWRFTRICHHVPLKNVVMTKSLLTHTTLVYVFTSVSPHVSWDC